MVQQLDACTYFKVFSNKTLRSTKLLKLPKPSSLIKQVRGGGGILDGMGKESGNLNLHILEQRKRWRLKKKWLLCFGLMKLEGGSLEHERFYFFFSDRFRCKLRSLSYHSREIPYCHLITFFQ